MSELLCILSLGCLWKVGDYLLKRERQARQVIQDSGTQVFNRSFITGKAKP